MLAPGTTVVCPHCRVFADALAADLPAELSLRCPWCNVAELAARWAEVAEATACPDCQHPLALHVAWYTANGEAPSPFERALAKAVDAPCTICRCRRTGGREVVVA
jgi:hypothetical protein